VTFLLSQWRAALFGVVAIALVIFGFQVSHWRERAKAADIAEAALSKAIQAQVDADVARAKAEKALAEKKTLVDVQIKEVIRRVKFVVHDKPGCGFSPDAIRLLNDAKRGTLSSTTGEFVTEPPAAPADAGTTNR